MSGRESDGRGAAEIKQAKPGRPGGMGMGHGPGGGLGRPVEKAKDFKGTMRRLVGYLRPYRGSILLVFGMAVLSTAFSVAGPKILGKSITILFEGVVAVARGLPGAAIDYPRVGGILLSLLGLYLVAAGFSYATQLVMAGVSQRTVYSFRKAIDEKLARLPLKYFDGRTHGEILSRVTNDVDVIANTLQQSLVQVITSVVTLIGSVAMMFSISWRLSLVALATLPFYVLTTMFVAKRSQGYFKGQQKHLGELNGHVEEMYSGHQVVKAFGYEKESVRRFDEVNAALYGVAWKAQFVSGIIMPVMNFINNIGYVLIAVIGGAMAARRALALGDIQAFIQYARQFTQPIIQTANIANILQSTMAASERVFEVLDEAEEEPDAPASSPAVARFESACGDVAFESISFGYSADKKLMDGLELSAPCGETVAIVGPTGAGKTTLVNLLMRFYELDGGRITANGVDIRDVPRGVLRRSFGMVLQDAWLFGGTIRDNIAYGREGATEEEIIAAATAAHADHFIHVLPDGYDTVLNEEASNLSQGQRQLLTIARAFLADPRILILDEATSSVDTRTEMVVRKAMERLMEGRTSFVIAHRLSTIRDAHTILVMNEGSIVEKGSHEGLLAADGFYADLYKSQFLGIEDPESA
ncbi:MAG: ABC transporter ATP-binding protein/permease [Spirochaetes bacterium]|nr:ABC transporter ATP-binding protein/permease [Spirochaetota bacterium]MBU1082348.1 ABC transporter ATP-binding protein/permease [Spirochaetota bacterium]